MKLSICSKSYKYIKIVDLYDFGKGVKTGIYGNATVFVTPPISEAAFGVILEDFKSKRTAYKNGGKDQKGAYELAYNLLIKTLDDLGLYVNPIANGDTAIIVLAGYVPTQTGSGSKSAPVIVQPVLSTTTIGVIDADCSSIPNAEFYGAILASQQLALTITHEGQITAAPLPEGSPDVYMQLNVGKKRKKSFIGLNSGTRFYVYYYAGNSVGMSNLSSPVSIVCQ